MTNLGLPRILLTHVISNWFFFWVEVEKQNEGNKARMKKKSSSTKKKNETAQNNQYSARKTVHFELGGELVGAAADKDAAIR